MNRNVNGQSALWETYVAKITYFCERFNTGAKTERALGFVLVLFIWKYISDCWREEIESSMHVGGQAEVRIKLANSRFFVLPGASFYDVIARCGESEIGSYINQALEKISVANSPMLEGIFEHFDFASESDFGSKKQQVSLLARVMTGLNDQNPDMSQLKVSEVDFGELIHNLLSEFYTSPGGNINESYTDKDIAKLIASISQPEAGNSICDPVCGTGSLLIRVSDEVGANANLLAKKRMG